MPSTTIGMLWPGIACGLPFDELADARSDDDRAGEADEAAHRVHDARAGEVDRAVTEAPVEPGLREPAAAPDPVREEAVGQRDPEREERKFFHAQRPAIAPVGIVAVVSMKTIMKKKSAITPTSFTDEPRKKPLSPIRP